jgi:hypothetical protein
VNPKDRFPCFSTAPTAGIQASIGKLLYRAWAALITVALKVIGSSEGRNLGVTAGRSPTPCWETHSKKLVGYCDFFGVAS